MFRFHYKLALSSLLLSLCIPFAFANSDPCDNLVGTFKGTGQLTWNRCDWEVVSTFQKNQNNVRMEGITYNGQGTQCGRGENFTLIGTCEHGKLTLYGEITWNGTIFGNEVFINAVTSHPSYRSIHLFKQ